MQLTPQELSADLFFFSQISLRMENESTHCLPIGYIYIHISIYVYMYICVCVCVCVYPYIHISIRPFLSFFSDLAVHGERIDALLAHRIELFTG